MVDMKVEDDLVTFETAQLAKKKGFNEKVFYCYFEDKTLYNQAQYIDFNTTFSKLVSAPTQSFLQRWLREVHKIIVSIEYAAPDTNKYQYRIDSKEHNIFAFYSMRFVRYEEALEVALIEATNLINK